MNRLACTVTRTGPAKRFFRALLLDKPIVPEDGGKANILDFELSDIPSQEAYDVVVDVQYAGMNYKDGLAFSGRYGICSYYPIVPGVDFVGTVVDSNTKRYSVGDTVVSTGWDVGQKRWGGFSEIVRVPESYLIPLPPTLTPLTAMSIGSAGLTAMLCVLALEEQGITPDCGRPVLVTGAGGGVGCIAVAILNKLGYPDIVASIGKPTDEEFVRECGATSVLQREALDRDCRPLESSTFSAAIDVIGGKPLATLCSQLEYGGTVASTGHVGSSQLHGTLMPFILRAIRMIGVETSITPMAQRLAAWERLATDVDRGMLEKMTKVLPLGEVPRVAMELFKGSVLSGRFVVDVKNNN